MTTVSFTPSPRLGWPASCAGTTSSIITVASGTSVRHSAMPVNPDARRSASPRPGLPTLQSDNPQSADVLINRGARKAQRSSSFREITPRRRVHRSNFPALVLTERVAPASVAHFALGVHCSDQSLE